MNKTKQFALHFAAVALLVGTSAFADSRHSDATSRDRGSRHGSDRGTVQQRGSNQRDTARSYAPQQRTETRNWNNNQSRSFDRSNAPSFQQSRTYDRNRSFDNSRSFDRNRSFDNNRSFDRNRGFSPSYARGNAYYHDGRISRIEHWNGGYRVYLGGAPYPFFVPAARFSLFNWRVGLSIRLGGFYNPLGYYDYYDDAVGYPGAYVGVAPSPAYGDLRGTVDNVDYRRGSMVIRDDASGNFVTVMMRGDDPRFDSLRAGDAVDLSGDWVRGYFEAVSVVRLDTGYNDGYYRR